LREVVVAYLKALPKNLPQDSVEKLSQLTDGVFISVGVAFWAMTLAASSGRGLHVLTRLHGVITQKTWPRELTAVKADISLV
jgi:hypothetical protein